MPHPNDVCIVEDKDMLFRGVIKDVVLRGQMCIVSLLDHKTEITVHSNKIYNLNKIQSMVAKVKHVVSVDDFFVVRVIFFTMIHA